MTTGHRDLILRNSHEHMNRESVEVSVWMHLPWLSGRHIWDLCVMEASVQVQRCCSPAGKRNRLLLPSGQGQRVFRPTSGADPLMFQQLQDSRVHCPGNLQAVHCDKQQVSVDWILQVVSVPRAASLESVSVPRLWSVFLRQQVFYKWAVPGGGVVTRHDNTWTGVNNLTPVLWLSDGREDTDQTLSPGFLTCSTRLLVSSLETLWFEVY